MLASKVAAVTRQGWPVLARRRRSMLTRRRRSISESGQLEQKRMAGETQKRRPERQASARQARKFVDRSVESIQTEEEKVGPQLPAFDGVRRGGFYT